ncbi:MAG: Mlr7403 protein [uncultured Thiotrichaceae bacterium]|uniref:Ancillary SecYEG translocon subunit n=1 Tax=uncultured Thiotrichaceae bacterium TaxID=298394 RepID=A0A6S6T4E3_9GAMM|nr:MAG: Mlr7403 protein [uncultured Thiotrichaceae bacterium]
MTDFKTDEEKAEDIKRWWKENGTSVIAGVALAIAGLFGWEYWQGNKIQNAEAASADYLIASRETDTAVAQQQLANLRDNYSATPYAAMAALQSAKLYAEAGKDQEAATALQWVIDNSSETEYQEVARLRLARVHIAMKKYDDALALTKYDYGDGFESLLDELRGDIFAAQSKVDDARKAYERAILTDGGANELIQMKLDNLGKGA